MNMRIHIDKWLSGVLFFLLMMLCTNVEAYKDRKFIHQEIVENQQRLMDKNNPIPSESQKDMDQPLTPIVMNKEAKDDKGDDNAVDVSDPEVDDDEKNDNNLNSTNVTKPAEKKLSFWSGFVNSLSMIFFVEFGDRVSF